MPIEPAPLSRNSVTAQPRLSESTWDGERAPASHSFEEQDLLDAFMAALPSSQSMPVESPDFWNRLGVWHDRVVQAITDDSAWMVRRLDALDGSLQSALMGWLGYTVDSSGSDTEAKSLAEEIVRQSKAADAHPVDPTPCACVQTILLLDALLHGRSYHAIEEAAKLILPAPKWETVVQLDLSPRSKRLATALQIYVNNPADLELMMLYERAERFSYNRFRLIHDAQDREAGHRHPLAKQREESTLLTTGQINQALTKFEAGPRGGRHSRCLCVLHRAPDTQIVFIQRVLRQTSITEMERTLFGDEVETIVLKFHQQLTLLDERSTKGVGAIIGRTVAELVHQQAVVAVPENPAVTTAQLRRFLDALQHNEDPALTFVELNLRSAPLNGSPILMLRGNREQPLSAALRNLEEHGLLLLDEFADIRHLGVAFRTNVAGQPFNNIFKIRLEHLKTASNSSEVMLHYMVAQASSAVCKQFEEHMRIEHELIVVPAAR